MEYSSDFSNTTSFLSRFNWELLKTSSDCHPTKGNKTTTLCLYPEVSISCSSVSAV